MGYYSAAEREDVQRHVTTQMDLKNIILSERSQEQNATYFMVLFV